MPQIIIAAVVSLALSVGGWFGLNATKGAPKQVSPLGAFGDTFLSIQLATGPDSGECLTTDGTDNIWSTCASGGGGGGGTWSTTTSQVAGRLINYPNNATDIVAIGSNASTSAEWWYDPNTTVGYIRGLLGIGTTSPYASLSVVGQTVSAYFTATTTATSTLPNLNVSNALTVNGDYVTDINGTGLSLNSGVLSTTLGTAINSAEITNDSIVNDDINSSAAISVSKLALMANDGLTLSGDGLDCDTASGSTFGCLSITDWSNFNSKQDAGNYITALTGDIDASGPGSAAATLSTVNGDVGSFTNANITVNAKGLITAASNGSAGGGSGNVATSTSETSGYVPYWTSTGATPATLGSDSGFQYSDTSDRLTVTYASTTALTIGSSGYVLGTIDFGQDGSLSNMIRCGDVGNIIGCYRGTATIPIWGYNHTNGNSMFQSSFAGGDTQIGTFNGGINITVEGASGSTLGYVGIGTSTPYAPLSVVGQTVAAYFTATTSTASQLPYASSTAVTVSGALYNTSLSDGCLNVTSGKIGSTGSACGAGGGSGGGTWSTTTSQVAGQLINYPNNTTDVVVIGSNATTSGEYWFDPNSGVSYLSGKVGIGTTSPYATLSVVGQVVAPYYTATSSSDTSSFAGSLTTNGFELHNSATIDFFSDSGVTQIGSIFPTVGFTGKYSFTNGVVASGILDFSSLTNPDKTYSFPDFSGSPALGSYVTGFTNGSVPFGSSGLLATSSAFTFDSANTKLSTTYASTTAVSATSLCLSSDCRTSWPAFGGFKQLATSTSMSIDICSSSYATSSINAIGVGTSNIAVTMSGSDCKGKYIFIDVWAPLSGLIGSTTFSGVYWNGQINPGSAVVNGLTDRFMFTITASSTTFISAKLDSTY